MTTNYLITIHRPQGYDPATAEDAAMAREIDELNEAMIAAGVRVFVGGLQSPDRARSLLPRPEGGVQVREGLYLGAGESVGGLWVLQAENLEEAVEWGRRAAIACRAAVEVRPFH